MPITAGSAPYASTNGAPMPTVITVIAAKALPMIIVNSIMPTPNTMMPTVTLPLGMMPPTSSAITSPTPAAVKIAPRLASSIGSMHSAPIDESSRSESLRKTVGLLSREKAYRITAAIITPMQQPVRALTLGISAPMIANTPRHRAGTKMRMPMRLKFAATSDSLGAPASEAAPLRTCRKIAGMTMTMMSAPSATAGIHQPNAMTTPSAVQNMKVP